MRGNQFGKLFSVTSFGESHGPAMGVVLDGVPSNLEVSLDQLSAALARRAPGHIAGTTTRAEKDHPEILSGVFQGKTLGTPIAIITRNRSQRSQDYEGWKEEYRPGHADRTTELKYGHRDYRGGGRASGRETWARVVGGYFASLILPQVRIRSQANLIGPFQAEGFNDAPLSSWPSDLGAYGFPHPEKEKEIQLFLEGLQKEGRSCGGRVLVRVEHCPQALGEPVFDKLKADLAKACLSIGAVTSFGFGLGEEFAKIEGEKASKNSSYFGGIEGGISNGDPIILSLTIKPTSTVGKKAQAGRHDPCIIPRVLPVVESMVFLVLADHFLRQRAYEL